MERTMEVMSFYIYSLNQSSSVRTDFMTFVSVRPDSLTKAHEYMQLLKTVRTPHITWQIGTEFGNLLRIHTGFSIAW